MFKIQNKGTIYKNGKFMKGKLNEPVFQISIFFLMFICCIGKKSCFIYCLIITPISMILVIVNSSIRDS